MQHSDKFGFYKWCRQSQKIRFLIGVGLFEKLIGNNTTIADYKQYETIKFGKFGNKFNVFKL